MSILPRLPYRQVDEPSPQPEFCESFVHGNTRLQPRARYFHTERRVWLCSQCASDINRWNVTNRMNAPCITAEEYLIKLLTQS